MKKTLSDIKAALSRDGIPATVLQLTLPGGSQVLLSATVKAADYGDTHNRLREPTHDELKRTLHALNQWAGQVEME